MTDDELTSRPNHETKLVVARGLATAQVRLHRTQREHRMAFAFDRPSVQSECASLVCVRCWRSFAHQVLHLAPWFSKKFDRFSAVDSSEAIRRWLKVLLSAMLLSEPRHSS